MIQDFNWLDYGIVGIVTLSLLMGLIRGFVREAISLATWVSAIGLGIYYCEPLSHYFNSISISGLRVILAFIIIVLSVLIIGGIISHSICKLIKATGFGITDRIIGFLFGAIRGGAIIAIIIAMVNTTVIAQKEDWKHSHLIPMFEPAALWIKDKIPEDLLKKLEKENEKVLKKIGQGSAGKEKNKAHKKEEEGTSPIPETNKEVPPKEPEFDFTSPS